MEFIDLSPNTGPCGRRRPGRRDKVFGQPRSSGLDRNARARIVYRAHAYNVRHRRPGQHRGPITRAFMGVLEALLFRFHNSKDGRCFPSLERLADAAGCARSTAAAAINALEAAGLLTWVHRLARVRVTGPGGLRWRVIRTSNGYVFHDPGIPDRQASDDPVSVSGIPLPWPSESENPTGTRFKNRSCIRTTTETGSTPSDGEIIAARQALAAVRERHRAQAMGGVRS